MQPCHTDAYCGPFGKERSMFEKKNRNRATGDQVLRGERGTVGTRRRETKAFIFNNVFIQQILKNNTFKAKTVNSHTF